MLETHRERSLETSTSIVPRVACTSTLDNENRTERRTRP